MAPVVCCGLFRDAEFAGKCELGRVARVMNESRDGDAEEIVHGSLNEDVRGLNEQDMPSSPPQSGEDKVLVTDVA